MKNQDLTPRQLAGMIDHTLLKQYATFDELAVLCQEAIQYGFKTVAVNNAVVPFCRERLAGSPVLCTATVSFPFGQCTLDTKLFETRDVIGKGAGEVDYVVNLVELKSGHWDYVEEEMRRLTEVCRELGAVSKVIFENCFLTEEEKRRLCEVALRVGPDYIKTSTGYGTGGATLEDVRLMKACVGDAVKIKAAGGIRTVEAALAMIEAGASRIGSSAGVKIVDGYQAMLGQ